MATTGNAGMDLFSVLTLLYFVTAVCAGTHSLWYFITLTMGPSPFPEMAIVGMVDDVPVEYYDSVDRTMTSRWHWHKEEGNVAYAQMKRLAIAHAAHSLKNKLQHMMEHFNHSVKMRKDYWLIESYKGLFYQLYQPLCVQNLKSYLHQERSILKRKVRPRIRVLQKQVGGAGWVEVTCLATGFYPRHIEVTMKRDNHPVPEQELIRGDILPNGDGTYQLRMSLSVSAEELREGHRYTCSVRHVSMDNKLDIAWDSQPKPDIALISAASVTALATVLLILTGIFVLKKRKSKVPGCSRSGKIEEEVERMHAAEGVVKDAEELLEMERQED
ncbi:major histocompatibility complex class I-related gene protein-like isoform X5 [Anguilla rostrata]|uniref:major histocompatibility complex class I-related gene protein-like isoform X5 n=1 Tax=Anguilla rostrata TaxID=7938 RepID=UPI0030CF99E9